MTNLVKRPASCHHCVRLGEKKSGLKVHPVHAGLGVSQDVLARLPWTRTGKELPLQVPVALVLPLGPLCPPRHPTTKGLGWVSGPDIGHSTF